MEEFKEIYENCIVDHIASYYAIDKESKTSVEDFYRIFYKHELNFKLVDPHDQPYGQFLNQDSVEACFKINEGVYDFSKICNVIKKNIEQKYK